jgi:hypothetical protein
MDVQTEGLRAMLAWRTQIDENAPNALRGRGIYRSPQER